MMFRLLSLVTNTAHASKLQVAQLVDTYAKYYGIIIFFSEEKKAASVLSLVNTLEQMQLILCKALTLQPACDTHPETQLDLALCT